MDEFDDERFITLIEVDKKQVPAGHHNGFEHYSNNPDDEDDTLIRMILEAQ